MIALFLMTALSSALAEEAQAEEAQIVLKEYVIHWREGEPEIPEGLATPLSEGISQYGIVSFQGPIRSSDLQSLEASGLVPVRYLAFNSWIVRGDGGAIMSSAELDGVAWAGSYHPAYKISGYIGNHEFLHPERREDPWRLLNVCLFPGEGGALVMSQLVSMGAEVRDLHEKDIGDRLVVRAPDEMIPVIARLDAVEWIEEVLEFTLHNNRNKWVLQSNQNGVTPIWNHNLHGEGQMIGVMDSGLDFNSCFFRDPEGDSFGNNHRKVQAYRLTGGAAYDGCDVGHGTHVIGTILGEDLFGSNSNYNGIAYKARLTFQDVGQDDSWSCGIGSVNIPSNLETSYQNSKNDGAYMHTNSWGSSSNTYDSMSQDVDNFMWNNKDFLICFAMGNAGPGSGTIGCPATAKNCISVGATQQAPSQNSMASYSSRGPAFDNRLKPTVCAPGGLASTSNYINSANNHTGNPPSNTCNVQGNPFQGTSMATPAVAGSGLLVRQYFTEGYYPTGIQNAGNSFVPSAALIKAMLTNSGSPVNTNFPDNNQGWGRILIDDVLYFPGDARGLCIVEETPGLSTGQSTNYNYEVGSGLPLEITLVWTDYPAATSCGVAIVNDLDLVVTGPSGTFLGNVYAGGQSCTGGSADRRNVEECVQLNSPAAGTYTVTVSAHNIPHAPQPFALVVTGDVGGGSSDNEAPSIPQNVTMIGPDLSWSTSTDNIGVVGYRVYRHTDAYFDVTGMTPIATTSTTSHSFPGSMGNPDTNYSFRVTAFDAANNESGASIPCGEHDYETQGG